MADLGPTEVWTSEPTDYLDSTAAPVVTRYTNHGPTTPSPYDAPPVSLYEPAGPPRHFLPPYDYAPEPVPPRSAQGYGAPPPEYYVGAPHRPPPQGYGAPPPEFREAAPHRPPPQGYGAPPPEFREAAPRRPPPRDVLPAFDPPADMVIPGVQHPDGHFEPHPYFARRSAPGPPSMEPEEPEQPGKQTVEVAVPVCCEACSERITNYVGETPGVDAVECDVGEQKVTVTGDLAPADVLQRCRKCFRKAALV